MKGRLPFFIGVMVTILVVGVVVFLFRDDPPARQEEAKPGPSRSNDELGVPTSPRKLPTSLDRGGSPGKPPIEPSPKGDESQRGLESKEARLPVTSHGPFEASETVTADEVIRVMSPLWPTFDACYETHGGADPVVLDIQINADGAVVRSEATMGPGPLANCLIESLAQASFAVSGAARLVYPIAFEAHAHE